MPATLPVTLTNRGGLNWLPQARGMSWGAVSVEIEWRDALGRVMLRNERVQLKRRIRVGNPGHSNCPWKRHPHPEYILSPSIWRDSLYRFSEQGVRPFTAQVEVR